MVDKHPDAGQPQGEGDKPFFVDPEFQRRSDRLSKIATAHDLLRQAFDLDAMLGSGSVTKNFVTRSGGDAKGGRYPFFHFRVKLKPKNRTDTDIPVVALRFPSEIGFQNLITDKLYIAYEDSTGEEHILYLSAEQCSRIEDPRLAFAEPGEGTVLAPNPDALSPATEMDLLVLESILGLHSEFEPDLQPNDPDISA